MIAHSKLDAQISPDLVGKDLLVEGVITHITHKSDQRTRFWMTTSDLIELPLKQISQASINQQPDPTPGRIQLSWYNNAPSISVGQRWQLKIRLKQPRGFSNPGASDYEAWLYQNAISATGYVRSGLVDSRFNKHLGNEAGILISVHHLREKMSRKIIELLPNKTYVPLITALVAGDRQGMTDQQCSTLTKTGTNHLMAISGLHKVPLLSPLANFIAVPVVSLVTVPLSLLGACVSLAESTSGQLLLHVAHYSFEWLWPVFEAMANVDDLVFQGSQPPLWTLFPAIIGVLWLLAPSGLPARWIGIIWLIPLVFYPRVEISFGAYQFTLFDVGHGLAAIVRTQNQVLLCDAGPRYSSSFNAGDVAVVPYLKSIGRRKIDRIVLSHDDIDHVGGYDSIAASLSNQQLTVGQGVSKTHSNIDPCVEGQQWQWEGVHFEVLHPAAEYQSKIDNSNSCVVQISTETDKLLLTGDIEREVETQFVKFFAGNDDNLKANVLVVPHHGSLSSSSLAFVQAIQPDYALISTGFRNRYGLPRPEVIQRYRALGSRILNTAHTGAIRFLMGKNGLSELTLHREQAKHYWTSVTK